jgi:hypothetical protein
MLCAADGHTYEREVIEEWLATKDTSPLTVRFPSDEGTHVPGELCQSQWECLPQSSFPVPTTAMTLARKTRAEAYFAAMVCRVSPCHTRIWSPIWQ